MARKKKTTVVPETKFLREDSVIINGFEIVRGDIFKVRDEFGAKFKFDAFVTNKETGSQWVDCFEVIGTVPSTFRSFRTDRIKRIPKRGKRAKRVI